MKKRLLALAAAGAAVALTLSACGGSDSGSTTPNAAPDRLELTLDQKANHTMAEAESGRLHAQGLLFQTVAGPMGQIASSVAQTAAAADEAARLEHQAAAETSRQISSTQEEQASHDQQLRDSAFQVLQQLHNERARSNSQIIGNM